MSTVPKCDDKTCSDEILDKTKKGIIKDWSVTGVIWENKNNF